MESGLGIKYGEGGGRRAKKVSLLQFTAYSSKRLQLLHIIFVQASRHSN